MPTATPAWAAAEIARRFPASTHRGASFATAFAAARRDPAAQADELIGLAGRADSAGIVRASALDLLTPVTDPGIAARAAPFLADPDPLVRGAAAGLQRGAPPVERLARLAPVLSDPLRSVRVAAAKAALGADPAGAPEAVLAALQAATGAWQSALRSAADFPETHMQVAGAALGMRNFAAAEAAFGEAVALDPQLVDGWAMIARIRAATGNQAGARQALADGLAVNPGQPDLAALQAQMGP